MSVPRNSELPGSRNGRKHIDSNTSNDGRGNNNNGGNIGGSSKVRVVGRIRPLANYEIENGSKPIVTKVPGSGGSGLPETLQIDESNGNDNSNTTNRYFELDAVLDETSTQNDVYEKSGAQTAIAEDLFCGYNATILAYGQTGSGKTFTMGTAPSTSDNNEECANDSDGVIPRACRDLFDNVRIKCDGQAEVTCSYMEVYNEEIRDLLVSNSKAKSQATQLRIRETLDGQIYVRGLTERKVDSPLDVYKIMEEANQRRVVASTKMNATSSRSHAICVLKIKGVVVVAESQGNDSTHSNPIAPNSHSTHSSGSTASFASEDAPDDGIARTFEAKLTLVDLAGSERLKKTGAQGGRAKEGISINKGLFVLGQVVSALAEKGRRLQQSLDDQNNNTSKKKKKSIPLRKPPYRDSKLTRLLQDSLGGNSRTIMIACVSPADFNAEETINTLRYATQARNISNTATANMVETISQSEARKLKRDNVLLKRQIAELEATISKLTQEVTEEDLERSMSIIQQEHDLEHQALEGRNQKRRGSGVRKTVSIMEEEKKKPSSENDRGENGDKDVDKTRHKSNKSKGTKKKKKNVVALGDHFKRSNSEDEEKDIDDVSNDKDSVSLLADDIFENGPSHIKPLRRKLSKTSSVGSVRTIEEVEDENAELEARLLMAEKDVRATARDTAVELPKLKKRVKQLEDSLSESKWLEDEARILQDQLVEARADKESAERAAQQLANFMETQKHKTGFRGDELTLEKVNYCRHKLNEDWVRFVVVVLNSFKEEMRLLGDYFQMVVQVVESPDILDMLGMLNNRQRKQGTFQTGYGRWFKTKTQQEQEETAVAAEKELRNTLLKEHIVFFNARLVEIEDEVNLRSDSIDVVLESLANVRGHMEADFESEDEINAMKDLFSKKGEKLLSQLTELMAGKLFHSSQRPTIEVS